MAPHGSIAHAPLYSKPPLLSSYLSCIPGHKLAGEPEAPSSCPPALLHALNLVTRLGAPQAPRIHAYQHHAELP